MAGTAQGRGCSNVDRHCSTSGMRRHIHRFAGLLSLVSQNVFDDPPQGQDLAVRMWVVIVALWNASAGTPFCRASFAFVARRFWLSAKPPGLGCSNVGRHCYTLECIGRCSALQFFFRLCRNALLIIRHKARAWLFECGSLLLHFGVRRQILSVAGLPALVSQDGFDDPPQAQSLAVRMWVAVVGLWDASADNPCCKPSFARGARRFR